MKKALSVILALSLIFSMFTFVSAAENGGLKITVANDLHLNNYYSENVKKNNNTEDFSHVVSNGQLKNESLAVIKAFLEKAGTNDSELVLLPGDLTDTGSEAEHLAFSALLKEFESAYGKEVYVVPGNHDVLKISADKFAAYYNDFGYGEALEKDTLSASYTADLDGEYRLLAIDSCKQAQGAHGLTSERIEWIKAQGEKAKADGKKLIAMMHHNLLEHFILGSTLHKGSVVNKDTNLADVFAQYGIKYTFTGHTHDHDVVSYTAADGTVIYDIVTSALNAYPCPYREVTFGDEVKIETKRIDKIDLSLLPEGISENALKLAESDFTEYTRQVIWTGLTITFNNYTTASGLRSLLKLEDAEMNAIIDKAGSKLNEAINMPFMKADESEEGKSIEALVEKYSLTIPETDYKNMLDLAITFYQAHCVGDQYIPAYSDEMVLLTRGLAAVISYTLEDVSAEEYAKILTFLTDLLGIDIPVDFLSYAGSSVKRFEGVEIFLTTALIPVITEFSVDKAPADNNVTLPGYAELQENTEVSFLEKIINFFKKIFDAFRTMVAFLPFFNK